MSFLTISLSVPGTVLEQLASGLQLNSTHTPGEESKRISHQQLNQFFAQVERRAFRMAVLATGDDDSALDIVQDAMMAHTRNYSRKPKEEWGPLFHRVLQSKIKDWYRHRAVRNRLLGWLHLGDEDCDPIQQYPDPRSRSPEQSTLQTDSMQATLLAIGELPLRQQQCFLLRAWEGYSVKDTASIMACSPGSVKTHYSRALKTLKSTLATWQDDDEH